jgi:hypothetical protein
MDLDPILTTDRGPPKRIRCVVRDCPHFLIPPTRRTKGEACPSHGIRVHTSSTYSYQDATRNAILDRDLLQRIIRHPGKYESHRLGLEKSEDTVVFNVLRSFQRAGCLRYIARLITGMEIDVEPRLFLWSLELTDDSLIPWPLLMAARSRFEHSLPVERPSTEPDGILFHDGAYVILIEAKLTSPNPLYVPGPRRDAQSLTLGELLTIYDDPPSCQILDVEKAKTSNEVAPQLWRNVVFSSWLAAHAAPGTVPFFCNLTRAGCEVESFESFFQLVRPEYANRVVRLRWEDLFLLTGMFGDRLLRLRQYMAEKTVNLRPAFHLSGI